MKKILLTLVLIIAGSASSQYYPSNNDYGNSTYDGWGNNDFDYPDEYYYNYPTDYYPQTYYESYYNDYRNSIVSINWPQFFRKYRLSRYQIDQINYLNQLYPSYSSWNYYYGVNPDRWYYERFYALQEILGQRNFAVFQRNYYRGYSPVVYFQNYRQTYYSPRYKVRREYRNVNVDRYKLDRNTNQNARANNGLYDPNNRNSANNGLGNRSGAENSGRRDNGFREQSNSNNPTRNNGGFKDRVKSENTAPVRSSENSVRTRDNGFRSGNSETQATTPPPRVESRRSDSGARNGNSSTRSAASIPAEATPSRSDAPVRGGGQR